MACIRPENLLADLLKTLNDALGDSYSFQRELPGGGMSRVFVAHDRTLDRLVAVKVLSAQVAAELKAERFRLEIQLAAKLQHPHIVPLLASGEIGGIPYFTMPFIEGESLRARIARQGELPISDAIRTLRQIASAISYAHKHGVVHRDIKPDNVLLAEEFALVTDFGVAKALSAATDGRELGITSTGVTVGTPAYMSPEQAAADPAIDHRADIYAFGALAYEVLTGAPPFQGRTPQATLAAHAVQKPEPIEQRRAGIPHALAVIVMRCLEKRPADRPQTAAEILRDLDALVVTTSADVPVHAAPSSPGMAAPPTRGRVAWLAGAVGVSAIIAAGYAIATRGGSDAPAASADLSSVAVLPLVNVGGDKADEYFSDGMTDELANALGKLPGLRVASRTSAYAFKGRSADVREIGRQLRVQAVLEGTVRRSGDRLRVAAQLTNVSDGLALWSEAYERQASDVFVVQDDIARSIAGALKLKLGTHAQTFSSESRGTENLAAFDLYLRGRYFWNSRGAENLRLAITYFDSAIVMDARFARAHAALAIAYALLPEYTDDPPTNVLGLTRAAAERALSLDPGLAEAYTALGLSGVHDWKYREAEVAYKKAIELEPRYPTAHQWYGELFYQTGRADSAIARIRTAVDLDPLAPINASALGYGLVLAGKYDEAISVLKKGVELTPALGLHHAMLGRAYLRTGQYSLAVAETEASVRLDPELALREGFLSHVYGVSGQHDKAREIIARLEARQSSQRVSPVALAVAYLGVNDVDRALTLLEKAVDQHDISLMTAASVVSDRLFDPLRSSPRYESVLRRMNLLEWARRRGR